MPLKEKLNNKKTCIFAGVRTMLPKEAMTYNLHLTAQRIVITTIHKAIMLQQTIFRHKSQTLKFNKSLGTLQ